MTDTIVMQPKKKHRVRKPAKFGGKCTSPGGQSSTRYRKKHLLAYGMPGTPNGVCIIPSGGRDKCQCGGCGPKRAQS